MDDFKNRSQLVAASCQLVGVGLKTADKLAARRYVTTKRLAAP